MALYKISYLVFIDRVLYHLLRKTADNTACRRQSSISKTINLSYQSLLLNVGESLPVFRRRGFARHGFVIPASPEGTLDKREFFGGAVNIRLILLS